MKGKIDIAKKLAKQVLVIGILMITGLTAGYLIGNIGGFDPGTNNIVKAEDDIATRIIGAEAELRSLQETNSFNAVMQPGSEYAVMPRLEGELDAVNVQVGGHG